MTQPWITQSSIGYEEAEKELEKPEAIGALRSNALVHVRAAADLRNLRLAFEAVGFSREESIELVSIYYGAVMNRHSGGRDLPMVLLGMQGEPFGPAGKA
jgi:hypothetical protein